MPKQSLNIARFEGIIGSSDAHDIPPGAAVYAENLDMVTQQALFAPLPADVEIGTNTGFDAGAIQPFDDGTVAVAVDQISATQATLKVVSLSTFGVSTSSALGANSRYESDTAVSSGEAVHVGLGGSSSSPPYWVGTVFHEQFTGISGAATSDSNTIQFLPATIARATMVGVHPDTSNITSALPDTVAGVTPLQYDNSNLGLQAGTSYVYYASLVYDGFQEGPVRPILVARFGTGVFKIANEDTSVSAVTGISAANWIAASSLNKDVDLNAQGVKFLEFDIRIVVASLPRRVTGINIYRGENPSTNVVDLWRDTTSTDDPVLIDQVDITSLTASATPSAGQWLNATFAGGASAEWNSSGETYVRYTLRDEGQVIGGTYEQRTGVSAALETMQVHYGVSCVVNGFHVVGRCYQPDLLGVETWLFRSKPGTFDRFDWTQDYLVLGAEPNALVSFNGRVYAFCDGRTFVINPSTFDIEDEWEGIGAPARKSVTVTDRGMFWADDNNIWWHDGSRVNVIGTPILRNQYATNLGWLARTTTADPVLAYDALYDSVIAFFTDGAGAYRAYQFHVATQRWGLITFSATGPFITALSRNDGRIVFMVENGGTEEVYELFGHSTNKRGWVWVSATLGRYAEKTRLYHLYLGYKGTRPGTVRCFADNVNYTTGAESANYFTVDQWSASIGGGKLDKGQLTHTPGTYQYVRDFTLYLEAASGTTVYDVTNMSVVLRPITSR